MRDPCYTEPMETAPDTDPPAPRVMVVDDHAMVRQGLIAILARAFAHATFVEASDGTQALDGYRAARPDVVLLDLSMPGMDGVTVLGRVRGVDPTARVLVVTTYQTEEDVRQAIRAGASGYLLKDASPDQIVAAVRTVLAGERWLPPTVARTLEDADRNVRLTTRERQVLEHLAAGRSNKVIARALGIGEGTVKSHVKVLFGKLGVANRTEALAEAARRGLLARRPG